MLKFYKTIPAFLVLFCYVSYAEAVLNAVIISAARTEQSELTTPASITIITREEIEASGARHVVEVLQSRGGIQVIDSFGDGSRAAVSMRGFSGSAANANMLILVDGRRLNNTDTSSPDLNSILLRDVKRIEIIQGGSGVLYGDQAVGGVINIITTGARDKTGLLEATAGSYRTAGLRTVYGDDVTENLHYRVSAEVRQSDNYRRDNNEIEYVNVAVKSGYDYSKGHVYAELQHVKEDLQLPGSLTQAELDADRRQTFVDFINDFTNSKTDVFRFGGKYAMSESWSLEGDATFRRVDRDIKQSFRGFPATTTSTLKRDQTEFMPRLIGSIPVEHGNIQITAGVDFIGTDFDSEITSSEDKQKLLSEYVQVVYPVSEKVNLTTGFRHARVEDDVTSMFVNGVQHTSESVAELGFTYDVNNVVKLFSRVEQNFRFAKVDELTYVSPGAELRAQTGISREVGFTFDSGNLSSRLVVYDLSLEDEIAFDPSAPDPFGTMFGANVNFDPTTHKGVVLESSYGITSRIDVSGSYSYSDAKFDSGVFEGNDISGTANNSARANANYKFSDFLGFNLGAVYVGSRYLDGDNANSQGKGSSYTVLNTNLLYSYKNWKINFKINNVNNQKYFENANSFGSRFPLPERSYLLTAAWKFR
jgi:iron complex outermembrane receptor protein